MKQSIIVVLLMLFVVQVNGQLSLQDGTTNYLINFDATVTGVSSGSYTGSGFSSNPSSGQLDADGWATTGLSDGSKAFGVANTSGDHARGNSNGGVSSGGFYGFDIGGGNRAMGFQPTGGDWTPGTLTLKIDNNSSSVINDMDVDYKIYVRNDQNRASSLNFSISYNNSSYSDISSGNYTSPQGSSGTTWVVNNKNIQLSGLQIDPGTSFYIRWSGSDTGGSGSRDELALDDIAIMAAGPANNCTEPIAQASNLNFGTITANSIQASFTGGSADKYLVVESTSSSLGASPSDGVIYSEGSTIGNGEVIQYSNNTNINSVGLNSNTAYYYFIYSSNDNCTGGPDYLVNNPLSGSMTTQLNGSSNYYASIGNETCENLKTALSNLIDGHTSVSYGSLWTHYQTTDDHLNDSGNEVIVWDMYSDNPSGPENEFTFGSEQCGTYQGEGDCYNREHTFPKSWWGGSTSPPQYTDIFTVVPSDGWVNGIRSNNPYGEVQSGTETHITDNGCRLGSSSTNIPGYSGSVFEPTDDYKGDLARGYFYLATRYENEIASWENSTTESSVVLDGTSYTVYEPWMVNLLISWHNNDPVDQKEIDRNEAIYAIQGNRNPYIDHPEYVAAIWSTCNGSDTEAPSSPSNLSSTNTTETTTILNWNASTDNVAVTGYNVYQDGSIVSMSSSTSTTINGLTSGNTYTFFVKAYDAAGNESNSSNTINVTTISSTIETIIHEGYFESGWDGWQDGGSDCARYGGGTYSAEGNYSIRLRDNSNTGSAMTSPSFDISGYNTIDIDFSFYPWSMENNEDFWVRYYDGSSWQTVASFARGTDFNNNAFYTAKVVINSADYNFPTNAQFRFQCDASSNADRIYIDEVVLTADATNNNTLQSSNEISLSYMKNDELGSSTNALDENIVELNKDDELADLSSRQILVYPNPASNLLNIDLRYMDSKITQMKIFNLLGREVMNIPLSKTGDIIKQDISLLENGLYILNVINSNKEAQIIKFYVNK